MSRVASRSNPDSTSRTTRSASTPARTGKRRKKRKNPLKFLLILIILLAILVGGGGYYTLGLGAADPSSEDEILVDIPMGTGPSQILQILDEAGLVKNMTCAKINMRLDHYDTLQANNYVLRKNLTFREIMTIINEGDFDFLSKESIEVRDGARLQDIAAAISEQLPYSAKEILAKWADKDYLKSLIDQYWFLTDDILDKDVMFPLEGYLYADTYFVTDSNSSIEGFTEMCLDRMDTELSERKAEIEASDFSVHELLTLTSIVTKEGRAEDQPAIAGVFMNRLAQGMSLGSDVTVCYIFNEDRVELYQAQLDSDNPFNTRKFAGLPPGPISTVVGSAIDAVLNYKESDDLFFFADGDGVVHYYKTNADFEQGIEDEGLLTDED